MLDELPQCVRPSSLARPPAVQTYGHHLRVATLPFAVQLVDSTAESSCEAVRRDRALGEDEPDIVVGLAVRDHEVALAVDFREVGKVVVVRLGVIDEAALLDEEIARPGRRAVPPVPADRP